MVVVVWDDVLNISVGKVVESRSLAFGRFAVYSRLTSRDADTGQKCRKRSGGRSVTISLT